MLLEAGDAHKLWEDSDFTTVDQKYTQLGEDGVAKFEWVAFWINPFLSKKHELEHLQEVLDRFTVFWEPFRDLYPFLGEPMEPNIVVEEDGNNTPYIYGFQEVPGLVDEELLRGLLWRFLKEFQDLWIHIQDDNYYLSQEHGSIPSWLRPLIATNRLWINYHRVLVIPQKYVSGMLATLAEAVEVIRKYPFNMEVLDSMAKVFQRDVDQFVSELAETVVVVDPETAAFLCQNPWLVGRLSWHAIDLEIREEGEIKRKESKEVDIDIDINMDISLNVVVPNWMAGLNLSTYIKDGMAVLKKQYLQFSEAVHKAQNHSDRLDFKYGSRNELQRALISQGFLDTQVDPVPFVPPEKEFLKEELLTERLQMLFDHEGVKNKDDANENDKESDIDEVNLDTDEEADRQVLEEFRKEGVLIDEDDFFEFFLKNALHLKDADLDQYVKEYNDESDYESDGDEFK